MGSNFHKRPPAIVCSKQAGGGLHQLADTQAGRGAGGPAPHRNAQYEAVPAGVVVGDIGPEPARRCLDFASGLPLA